MLKRLVVVVLSSVVLVSIAAAPSDAAARKVRDKSGDVSGAYDIFKVKFANKKRKIKVRATVNTSTARNTKQCASAIIAKPRHRWPFYSARVCFSRSKPNGVIRLIRVHNGGSKHVRCRGMGGRWGARGSLRIIQTVVPHRCLKKVGRHKSAFRYITDSPRSGASDNTRRVPVRRG